MNYSLILTPEAQQDLRKLPKFEAKRLALKTKILESNPFPKSKNPKKLSGDNSYRLRIGNYRALYKIKDNQVIVFAIGDRKNVYRRIK